MTQSKVKVVHIEAVQKRTIHIILKPHLHDTSCCLTSCQAGLTTGCIVYINIQPVVKPVWQTAVSCIRSVVRPVVQPGLTTGWTNSGCSCNTVVKPVVNPVWQPVGQPVGCLFTFFLHDTVGCQTGCTTVLTTGCNVQTGYKFFSWHAVHCYVICSKSNYSGLS